MLNRRFLLETATIVGAAVLCAAVSNGLAARDRKVKWIASSPAPAARVAKAAAATPVAQMSVVPAAPAVSAAAQPQQVQPLSPQPAAATAPADLPSPAKEKTAEPTQSAPAPVTAAPPPTAAAPAVVAKQFPAHPDKPYVEISSEDAKVLFDRGAIFFDARRTSVFQEGHIRGARNISVWEADLDDKVNEVFAQNLDPETPIVVYCAGGACEDSHMLSQRLWGIGLNAVFVYKDGFPDWQKNGWPVTTGAQQ